MIELIVKTWAKPNRAEMATAKLESKPGAICVAIRNCVTYKDGLRASFENWFTTKTENIRFDFVTFAREYVVSLHFKGIMMLIIHPQ